MSACRMAIASIGRKWRKHNLLDNKKEIRHVSTALTHSAASWERPVITVGDVLRMHLASHVLDVNLLDSLWNIAVHLRLPSTKHAKYVCNVTVCVAID